MVHIFTQVMQSKGKFYGCVIVTPCPENYLASRRTGIYKITPSGFKHKESAIRQADFEAEKLGVTFKTDLIHTYIYVGGE